MLKRIFDIMDTSLKWDLLRDIYTQGFDITTAMFDHDAIVIFFRMVVTVQFRFIYHIHACKILYIIMIIRIISEIFMHIAIYSNYSCRLSDTR